MIGRLKGILLAKHFNEVLMDVGGVGYEIFIPLSTYERLPEVLSDLVLHTHFVVREDDQHLYGFSELRERMLFRALLKVNGVGPKLALSILSSITPELFVQAVVSNDIATLNKLQGVGKKTAERLIVEMRDRLRTEGLALQSSDISNSLPHNEIVAETLSALISLGYKSHEATRCLQSIDASSADSSQSLLRMALQKISTL